MTTKPATGLAPVKTGIVDPLFRTFQERLNRLFGEAMPGLANWPGWMEALGEENWSMKTWAPKCDIFETETEIVVKVELPDVKREDLHVGIEENVLTVRGERKFEEETKRENYHRVERSYGEFRRSFTLPTFADPAKVTAEYKEGVLRVAIGKKEEAKPKTVEVKVA